jgi:hypothetical protein
MLVFKVDQIMFNFFYLVVIKKTQESSKDPANGGCGD